MESQPNHEPKKKSGISRQFWVFLAVVGIVAIWNFLFSKPPKTSNSQVSFSSPPSARRRASAAPVYTPAIIDGARYWGETVSGVTFVIYSVRSAPTLVTPAKVFHTQGRFIIVRLVAQNNQKSAVDLDDSEFRLVSKDGVRYSASDDDIYLPNSVNLAQLNPGISRQVQAAFVVPSSIPLASLQFRAQGGMTGNQVLMPLRPLSGPTAPSS